MTAAPVLSTERLVLRPRQPADIEAVYAAAADPDLVRWLPSWAGATMADIVEHVNRPDRPNGVDWAITARGEFAGECWLARIDELNRSSAAGYWLAPEARGSGYAAEALATLAAWGFADLGLERIELHAAEGNIASQRAALRAGFRREGRQRRAARCDGETVDLLEFARLRNDPAGPAPRLLPDVDTLTDGAVVLRPIRPSDADAWQAERLDPETLRWTPVPLPPDLATARKRTAGAQAAWLAGTEAAFAVLEGGEYAGSLTVRITEPEIGTGEVGYSLLPAFRGRGLMIRALRLVGRWAFTEVGLDRVAAGVGAANTASLRTAEAAGFRREGILRQGLPGPDGRYDVVLLSLLRDDVPAQPHQKDAAITP